MKRCRKICLEVNLLQVIVVNKHSHHSQFDKSLPTPSDKHHKLLPPPRPDQRVALHHTTAERMVVVSCVTDEDNALKYKKKIMSYLYS